MRTHSAETVSTIYKRRNVLAAASMAGILATTAACSSNASLAKSSSTATSAAPTSAPAMGTASTSAETGCVPEVQVGETIDSTQSTPVIVLAGAVQMPDGEVIGRPLEVQEDGKWDIATLQSIGGTVWRIVNPVPISDIKAFTKGPVDTALDGCLPSFENAEGSYTRPWQGQAVTITGTLNVAGQIYPSFDNYDSTSVSSANDAFAYYGATTIPLSLTDPSLSLYQPTATPSWASTVEQW